MSKPPRAPTSLTDCFDDELICFLVDILDESYRIVGAGHDPSVGMDNSTFGYTLYKVVKHQLIAALPDNVKIKKRIKVLSRGRAFRLSIDDRWEVGIHKVGHSAADDIWSSFPSTDSEAVHQLVFEQLELFPPNNARAYRDAKTAIIAHLGNYRDGLCALYACIPTSVGDDDKIDQWGAVHALIARPERGLYATSGDTPPPNGPTDSTPPTMAVQTPAPVPPPADEKIDEVALGLKKKKNKKPTQK